MPRKVKRNWAKTGVLVAIVIGYFCTAVPMVCTGIACSWDIRDVLMGIIALSLIFYILYNEVTKVYVR